MKSYIEFIQDNKKEILELNPLSNSVETKDGLVIKWDIDPKISFSKDFLKKLDESKIKIESKFGINSTDFRDKDVEVCFGIEGQEKSFVSPMGEDGFKASVSFKIRY